MTNLLVECRQFTIDTASCLPLTACKSTGRFISCGLPKTKWGAVNMEGIGMASRWFDFLFVVLLIVIACSGTSLTLYAVWHIARRICTALHTLLTCRDYCKGADDDRSRLVSDPVMHDILTMRSAFRRNCAPFSSFSRDLQRLHAYRYERARRQTSQMIWDNRLGALLTRDEHEFLYGPSEAPAVPTTAPAGTAVAAG